MRNFYSLSKTYLMAVPVFSMLAIILSMYVVYLFVRNRANKWLTIVSSYVFLKNVVIMYVYSCGLLAMKKGYKQNHLIDNALKIPVLVLYLILVLSFIAIIIFLITLYKHLKMKIVPSSISRGLNELDSGICICESSGLPRLVNRYIDAISFKLTGRYLFDGQEFISEIKRNKDNEIISDNGRRIVCKNGDDVYEINISEMLLNNINYLRILALDITEEYNLIRSLDVENKRRKDYQRRLKEYSDDLEKLTIEEEILKTKMNIHNSYGQILLVGKYSLEHIDSRREFISRWKKLSNLVFEEDSDDMSELFRMAGALGVNININASIDDEHRVLIEKLLYEVFTNTSKHTNSKNIYLDKSVEAGYIVYSCYNDEINSDEGFEEGGGLSSFHNLVTKSGAILSYELKPYFKVKIAFKER